MTYNAYYDLWEQETPLMGFGEIIKNPIAVIFYLFCLYILIGWIVYFVQGDLNA